MPFQLKNKHLVMIAGAVILAVAAGIAGFFMGKNAKTKSNNGGRLYG